MPEWKELSLFIGDSFGPLHSARKPYYYEKAFSKVKNQTAVGEASTAYLFDEAAPKIIKEQLGTIRIIIILRDPVAMSYSLYNHQLREQLITGGNHPCIGLVSTLGGNHPHKF